MANTFYHRVFNPLPGQRVDEQVLKDEFQRVELGFDGVAGQTAQLSTKANLAGGNAFTGNQSIAGDMAVTGTVTADGAVPVGDNSQKLASTNWVQAYVSSLAGLQLGLPAVPVQASPLGLFAVNGVYQWSPTLLVRLAYEDRGQLRTLVVGDGAAAIVEGLGLLVYRVGSTEIDDDETCFATAGGRWLMEAAAMDVFDGWLKPQLDQLMVTPVALQGVAISTLVSVGSNQNLIAATVVCPGAAVGDRVLVTPPGPIQNGASCWGTVSAANTVVIYVGNPSAGAAGTNVGGPFRFTVLKENP